MQRIPIGKAKRFEILNRDNFTCQYCGRKAPDVELEVDHIKPVAKGGSNEDDNLITACHDCNIGKSAKLLRESSLLESAEQLIDEYENAKSALEKFIKAKELLHSYSEHQITAMVTMWISCVGLGGDTDEEHDLALAWLKNDARRTIAKYGRVKALEKWYKEIIDNMCIEEDIEDFTED